MRRKALAVAALAALPALVGAPAHGQAPGGGGTGDPAPDTIAPSITITAPPTVTGSWYAGPVTITASADDDELVASLAWQLTGAQTGTGVQAGGDPVGIPVSAEGVTALDLTAKDAAGNVSTRRWWVSVDLTAPTITTNLADGAQVVWGTARTWSFDCADAAIGLESCTSSLGPGQPLPTDTLGPRALAVAAVDKVGHRLDLTVHYTVVPASLTLVQGVTLTGLPRTGATLTVVPSQWTPQPETRSYQWIRGSQPIPGAIGTSYTLTPDDVGHTIWVKETVTRTNYASRTVGATGVVGEPGRLSPVGAASLTGSATPGGRLIATPPVFEPTADVGLRWLRNGRLVATGASYDVTAADAGALLAVAYVARRAGYADAAGTIWSSRIARLPSRTTARAVKAGAVVKVIVRVSATGTVPAGRVSLLRKGRVVATAGLSNGTARFRVARKHARQTLVVRYAGSAQVAPSQSTVRIPAR